MKKRGFLCICLTVIMLVGLLPGGAAPAFMTVQAAASERFVLIEAQARISLSDQPISYDRSDGRFTVRVGTSVIMDLIPQRSPEEWLSVWPTDDNWEWDFLDFDIGVRILARADDSAVFTFEAPGNYMVATLVGGMDFLITVVEDAQPHATPLPNDIPSPWAVEQVGAAIAAGLVPQALQSSFTQAITRVEFAALAVALYETVTGREIAIDRSIVFSDTTDINVHKAATIGVVTGVGNNRFAPDDQLTREQAAVMLARLADAIGQPFSPSAPTFADNANVSSWAVDAVGQMQASGIMGGVGDNRFDPQGAYTREQSIVTILRLFEVVN